MNQTVERILNGNFDYEKGGLDISVSRIEMELCPGEVYTGSFFIASDAKQLTEGHIYSNDIRLELITDSFMGPGEEIGYNFSAVGLEAGDIVAGEIYIISNQGEYYIPYNFTIRNHDIDSSMGDIKNLFHFTNLAKAHWDEAVKLFYSDNFINVFTGNDIKYKSIYRGLSRFYGNEQNVEEFLLAINKKQPIEYILERDSITLTTPEGIVEETVNVTRNGWGYTYLHVETDADFVKLDKTDITDNDFLGNYLCYRVLIDSSKLHAGINYAKLTFSNSFVSFSVKIMATGFSITKQELSRKLEYMHTQYDLFTLYEAFRTKKINMDKWLGESKRIVDRMLLANETSQSGRLFRAQLLMVEERYNEAKWLLDQMENEFHASKEYTSAAWAYYLYLTTLYNREESYIDEITVEVENIYAKDPSQWRVAWLLLYLSEEFAVSPSRKWLFIEEQIKMQCTSPIMYVEAVNILLSNPSMLTRLGDYEIKVMRYAANNELLTDELIMQFVYLAGKERKYRRAVYEILKKCYEQKPEENTLQVICELLIKGKCAGEEYYHWYLSAIEAELKVTRLYEYYMQSLDIEKEYDIPKMVFLFFSYQSSLSWEYTAYLYARVIGKREEMPEVFESYKEQIERFTMDAIEKEYMNRDMAVIYRFMLPGVNLTPSMCEKLAKLIFVHRLTVTNDNLLKVVVYQNHEKTENIFRIDNLSAFAALYSKDCTIMFEDSFSNRYVTSENYEIEKLIVPSKLAAMLLPNIHDNLSFDVYACECSSEMVEIRDDNRDRYQKIIDAPEIEDEYKSEIRTKLMTYYADNDDIRELDALLESIDVHDIGRRERSRAIYHMIQRGMFDRALEWIKEFGKEGIEQKNLVKLCSRLVARGEFAPDETLTRLSASAFFAGKYDEIMLKYLVMNYRGMTRDMRKIFKAAEDFDVDIYSMCENLIIQMLYTGYFISERMDIYKKYIQGGANTEVQAAFLAQCAFDYFVKEQLMESFVFEELTKAQLRGEPVQTVCKLAYLKYYAENREEADDSVMGIIREYLDEMLEQGIYMSFFKDFLEKTTAGVNRFSDKTIIEYKTEPGKKVTIHYIIEGDEDSPGEYVTDEMKEMYGGVHAKAFVLFFGENLLYYITEGENSEEMLTESASISKSDISHDILDSRFNEINDIVIAKTLQDYDAVNSLLYDYQKHDYIVKNFFSLQ